MSGIDTTGWKVWCFPCRGKAEVLRGGTRYAWWESRRGELAAAGQAMTPPDGGNCFMCGDYISDGNYHFSPLVWNELQGGGGVITEICSECWYEDNTEPPTERVDKQKKCDKCKKELVQVIVSRTEGWDDDDDDDEDETVEIRVSLTRPLNATEYASVVIEVPTRWADDWGYYEDDILEAANNQGYGPEYEQDYDYAETGTAEVTEVEVM